MPSNKDTDGFEIYPIIHREKLYKIIAPDAIDMTFVEVRAMLDWLEGRHAFSVELEEGEPGTLFTCDLPGATLELDVRGIEIIVLRRTET